MTFLDAQSHWRRTNTDGSTGPLQHIHCRADLPILDTISGRVRLVVDVVMFQFQGSISKLQWGGEKYTAERLMDTGDADGHVWTADELAGDPTRGMVKVVKIPIAWDTTKSDVDGMRRTIVEVRGLLDNGNSQSVRVHFPVRLANGEGREVIDVGGKHQRVRVQAWISFPPSPGVKRSQSGYGTLEFIGGWPPLPDLVTESTVIDKVIFEGTKGDDGQKNTVATVAVDTNLHTGDPGTILFNRGQAGGMFETIPFNPDDVSNGPHTLFFRASGQAPDRQELATVVVLPFATTGGVPPPPPRWTVTVDGRVMHVDATVSEVLTLVGDALGHDALEISVSQTRPTR